MSAQFTLTQNERNYLRELAKKYLEYANLPVMAERQKLWYDHNSLKGARPVIVMEQATFEDDILPPPQCTGQSAQAIERFLMSAIRNHELVNDDKVISPYYTVFWDITIEQFGVPIEREYAQGNGKKLGYVDHHPISDLKKDFARLKPSRFQVNRASTYAWKSFVEEIIGDILPVKIKNNSLFWHVAPSQKVVELMGLEAMMTGLLDYPAEMHALYRFLTEDIIAYVKWQEKEGLLTLNNGNDYAGAGSYGFTTELPTRESKETGGISARDLWLNMNSQETVGISPRMYGEFIFPYYYELAEKLGGLIYYGCCEPVDAIWGEYLRKIPGLRKVSVSPWCNEELMGEPLRGSKVIYSRKPRPNYVGVAGCFDESAFAEHITNTLKAAKGCELEIIFRDIYSLGGDVDKPGRAIKMTRDLIDKLWCG